MLGHVAELEQEHQIAQSRKVIKKSNQKIWVFAGDGEMDEPESLGAISMAGREKLDNLIMVINCNLQRLDGPVRGNSKIIQELEGVFRGAGWNVVKVIWGRHWDPILAKDKSGKLQKLMNEILIVTFDQTNSSPRWDFLNTTPRLYDDGAKGYRDQ